MMPPGFSRLAASSIKFAAEHAADANRPRVGRLSDNHIVRLGIEFEHGACVFAPETRARVIQHAAVPVRKKHEAARMTGSQFSATRLSFRPDKRAMPRPICPSRGRKIKTSFAPGLASMGKCATNNCVQRSEWTRGVGFAIDPQAAFAAEENPGSRHPASTETVASGPSS